MSIDAKVDKALLDMAAVARSMLEGRLSFIEGSRDIVNLRWNANIGSDEDVLPFELIASETDAYPMGDVRERWAPAALANLRADIDRSEQWARKVGQAHCRNLIERFGGVSKGPVRNESEFWIGLLRRMNGALRSSRDNSVRVLWIDGLIPNALLAQLESGTVLAWVFVSEDGDPSFVEYRVCLHLGPAAVEQYRNEEWLALLSKENLAASLSVNRAAKEIDVT